MTTGGIRKLVATVARRRVLSTHLTRRTAAKAQAHYEQLQDEAQREGPGAEYARLACAQLGISFVNGIAIRRGRYEKGQWVVEVV